MALQLKRKGIERVFPMIGGMEEWIALGFEVDDGAYEPGRPAFRKPSDEE